jgi:hypothetical protein
MRTERRQTGWTSSVAALGFLLVFAVTAYAGANIVVFYGWGAGSVSAWKNTSGTATEARTLAFELALATPGDTAAIDDALDEIVKASPASVAAWQLRVAYQAAQGAPIERVLPGFRMSVLTGSHEGYYMAQRAMFGLQHWSELPEEDRRAVIRDLVEFGPDRYRNVLALKTRAERDEIRAAVISSGRAKQALLQVLAE